MDLLRGRWDGLGLAFTQEKFYFGSDGCEQPTAVRRSGLRGMHRDHLAITSQGGAAAHFASGLRVYATAAARRA